MTETIHDKIVARYPKYGELITFTLWISSSIVLSYFILLRFGIDLLTIF